MNREEAYNYIRSRYVKISEVRQLIKKHKLNIKYGDLSIHESKTVETVINKFLKERGLALEDLRKNLVESTEFPIHDLIYECTQACDLRTFKSIHTHIAYTYNPFIHCTWDNESEVQLLDLVNQKGFRWKEISYHIAKFKDLCRIKYLSLKGISRGKISKEKIEALLNCMPTSDAEWEVLCEEMKLTKTYILRVIKKYLNGKELKKKSCELLEIHLLLLILNNNHYCKFTVDVSQILDYLNSPPSKLELVELIDGSKTPFISKKGQLKRTQTSQAVENSLNEKDQFEHALEKIQNIDASDRSQARFLNKFLNFFNLDPSFKLDIEIVVDDIFWYNISKLINLTRPDAMLKFNQLKKMYCWKTYKDVYDTVLKISYDYVMICLKKSLVDTGSNNPEELENPVQDNNEKVDITEKVPT